jgi:DNA-binding transcriptional regulator YiaG
MPNLASVLKEEIRRLARKEIKAQVSELRASSGRHRKEIAALKRVVASQDKQLARMLKGKPVAVKEKEGSGASHRFSPSMVQKHRAKMELAAADYAKLVGVSPLTVYNWEKGKTRPQAAQPHFALNQRHARPSAR